MLTIIILMAQMLTVWAEEANFLIIGGSNVYFSCKSENVPIWTRVKSTKDENLAIGTNKMARFRDER